MEADTMICETCGMVDHCETGCAAASELRRIWEAQDEKDKKDIIRRLARRLGIPNAERSQELQRLADKIIRRVPSLSFIKGVICIGYVMSYEHKKGERIRYADCRRVREVFRAWLPYDFIITFYYNNTSMLSENQQKIVMLHELMHIGMGPKGLKLVHHDVEDFKVILREFGLDWGALDNRDVPDILLAGLDGDIDEGEEG
jgi:predicted metallopeptidase